MFMPEIGWTKEVRGPTASFKGKSLSLITPDDENHLNVRTSAISGFIGKKVGNNRALSRRLGRVRFQH